jgi:competence protein ComEA
MKELPKKPIPHWWLAAITLVVLAAGVLGWMLIRNAPPQNAVLIEPAASGGQSVGVPQPSTMELPATIEAASPTPAAIAVYVSGAVAKPGVYTLAPESRVADAVEAAGGFLPDADAEAINLAARVQDEAHISVPERRPTPLPGTPIAQAPPTQAEPTAASTGAETSVAKLVNINTAGPDELETLPLIGSTIAGRIIEYRTQHGPFRRIEDLTEVAGIGESALERLRPLITVGP